MAMEQGLYAQVVMILWKESENKKWKEKTKKYNFQGKSARSRSWFDLDREWLEENPKTREPDFYYKQYQKTFRGDNTKTYKIFGVPIGDAKTTRKIQLCPAASVIKYHQKSFNSFFLVVLHQTFTVSVTTGMYLTL